MNAPVPSIIALQWAPLSFAQQRLWFFSRLESGSSAYNIGGLLRFDGALDLDSLRELLKLVCSADALHVENLGQWLEDEDGRKLVNELIKQGSLGFADE